MGCPGGMSTSQYTRSVCTRAFGAIFSLSFPRKRLQWEKKIVVPCLDVIRLPFSSEMYSEVVFLPEKRALILSECPLGNP